MVGRAWVSVLLLAILFGCAPRSRSKLTATVTYYKGCEQPAVVVK